MGITEIIIAAFVILFIWMYFRRNEKARLINKLPGPKAYPLVGNLLDTFRPREDLFQHIIRIYKEHGPLFRTWLGPLAEVHIGAPEHMETILSSHVHTKKGYVYIFLYPWLGKGLLTSDGQKWFTHRKMITPTFHFKILDSFIEVYRENSEILVRKLEDKARTGEVFDVYPFITYCALDIICETAMGTKVKAQDSNGSPYVTSIYSIANLTLYRFLKPWLYPDFIFKRTPSGKQYERDLSVLHGFTKRVINERIEERKAAKKEEEEETEDDIGTKKRKAFLDLLLEASEGDQFNKLTHEEIREEVDTFMFEGHDTTTAGICWVLLLLGHHSKIQEDAYHELGSIFSDDPARAVTMKDFGEMKLLERIIKESLRMFPSVPVIQRYLDEDLQMGKYLVPSGTTLTLHIFNMHHDPKVFPNPEAFDPDRFLPENSKDRHPYAYVPFSAGPRNCIGQKFALLEEKAILSTLIRNYKFESVEKIEDLTLLGELILRPASGVKIKISKREK